MPEDITEEIVPVVLFMARKEMPADTTVEIVAIVLFMGQKLPALP